MEKIIVGRFLRGRPSLARTPAHLRARAGLLAHYRATIADRRGRLPPIPPAPRPRVAGHRSSARTTSMLSYPGSKKHRTEASIRVPRMFNHTHSNNMINR
jgi:hypothetical protein